MQLLSPGQDPVGDEIAITPRVKKVLVLAQDEAAHWGVNYIGTEHLLLGILREGEGVASQVLAQLGVEPEKVRKQVIAYDLSCFLQIHTHIGQSLRRDTFSLS